MTETELAPETVPATTTTQTWDAQFQALKATFPRAKDSIVFCVHVLRQNPDIAIEDLKAQAAMHGIKVTAASVNAAQKLMAPATATSAPTTPAAAPLSPTGSTRPARRVRATKPAVDTEALIRNVIGKIQGQGSAEAERLRDGIRKAIAMLQSAVGS